MKPIHAHAVQLAEKSAALTQWELDFCSEYRARIAKYGAEATRVSAGQERILVKITAKLGAEVYERR